MLGIGRQKLLKDASPGDGKRAAQPFRLLLREKGKERVEEADIVIDTTAMSPEAAAERITAFILGGGI